MYDKIHYKLKKKKRKKNKQTKKNNSTFKKWRSFHPVPSLHGKQMGKNGNSDRLYFLGLQNPCGWWLQPCDYKMLASWKESHDKPRERIKKQRHHFADKGPYSQSHGFSSSQVQMWELDWAQKNWCFQTVGLEKKLLRAPLGSNQSILKESNPEYSLEGPKLKL